MSNIPNVIMHDVRKMPVLVVCHKCKKTVNEKQTALCCICKYRFEPDCVGYPAQTYRLKSPESKNKWRCTSCITKTGSSEENYNAANVTIRKKKYLSTTMTPESKESRSVSDRDLAMLPYSTPSKTVHDTPWSTPKSSVSDQPEYQISAHLHTSFSLNEQTLSRSMDHAALDAINIQEMEESMEQLQSELISTQNKLELTILENNDLRTHVKKLTKENSTLKMLLGHSPNCKQNKNKAHNSMLTSNKTGVMQLPQADPTSSTSTVAHMQESIDVLKQQLIKAKKEIISLNNQIGDLQQSLQIKEAAELLSDQLSQTSPDFLSI
ncbi:hypothetical protein HW555_012160 [Spodoptera exigua]|uniref:PHD-type domain-containing protein n=1 Tax=Spodoptera exigua TaxID=7107 RepID=A0A835KZW8_SPOEX|nr:hypothetical protein HW555_012160 [Spodoptera exigua]